MIRARKQRARGSLRKPAPPHGDESATGHLRARDVRVSFDGLRALDGVDIEVPAGTITGLIGPNGSGKTTLINVISGAQPANCAELTLDELDLQGLSDHERARAGVARTFQAIRLFESLSVIENVMLGATRLYDTSTAGSVLRTPASRREQQELRGQVEQLMSTFGNRLLPRVDQPVMSLSYANRRRTEISRALASRPRLLLLDEPTAGMNPHETAELGEHLAVLVREHGCSAVLIEHKMDLITRLCPNVYVLDHGACIATGDPADVQQDPAVVEAFLGG